MRILKSTLNLPIKTKQIHKNKSLKSTKNLKSQALLKTEDLKNHNKQNEIICSKTSIEQNPKIINKNSFQVYKNSLQQIISMIRKLIQLNSKMNYSVDTLVISVKLLKKLLRKGKIEKNDIRLFVLTLFLICSKTFQARQVTIKDMVEYTKQIYKKKDFVFMQQKILKKLNYELIISTKGSNKLAELEEQFTKMGLESTQKITSLENIMIH